MEDVNYVLKILTNPFMIGLYLGLILCIVVYIRGKLKISEYKKEIKKLKEHLHTKLEIDAEANTEKKQLIENLKKDNENLRISIQSLSQKPGRKEIKQFYIYQKAIDIMSEKAPGFAPAWQSALKEGEEEILKSEKGLIPFIRKIIPSSYINPKVLEDKNSPDNLDED